jgi:hypothetical protein
MHGVETLFSASNLHMYPHGNTLVRLPAAVIHQVAGRTHVGKLSPKSNCSAASRPMVRQHSRRSRLTESDHREGIGRLREPPPGNVTGFACETDTRIPHSFPDPVSVYSSTIAHSPVAVEQSFPSARPKPGRSKPFDLKHLAVRDTNLGTCKRESPRISPNPVAETFTMVLLRLEVTQQHCKNIPTSAPRRSTCFFIGRVI